MKNLISTIIFGVLSTTTLFAQDFSKDALYGSDYQSISTLSEQAKFSILSSFTGTGVQGSNATVLQNGNNNTTELNLAGNGNKVITSQQGDNNNIYMDFQGTNSQYILEQDGDKNNLELKNLTSNGTNFQVSQLNNENGITVEGSGIGSLQSMKIEQTGGMKIIIDSNPVLR